MGGDALAGAKTVLDGQDKRVGPHRRGHHARRRADTACLGGDDVEIARAGIRLGRGKIAGGADRGEGALAAHPAQPKSGVIDGIDMVLPAVNGDHVMPCLGQKNRIDGPHGTGADHGDSAAVRHHPSF